MPQITLNLPEELFSSLRRAPEEFAQEMRLAAAIHWYRQGEISQEKAAQIAGHSREAFLTELGRQKIDVIPIDLDTLKNELEPNPPQNDSNT